MKTARTWLGSQMWPLRRPIAVLLVLCCVTPALAGETGRRYAVEHQWRLAKVKRVFVVILENTDANVAEGLPFVMQLAARGAQLRNYHGLTNPSQPNYIALISGSTHGVTGSDPVTIDALHLGDLLERKGLTWKVYAENYPGNCFLGQTWGTEAEGQYVRRHVPFLSFRNVQQNIARCNEHIVNAAVLDADVASGALPSFSFYVPHNLHNGHDSGPAVADTWLEGRLGPLLLDSRFMDDTLFIVTYDESLSTGNRVTTLFVGTMVKRAVAPFDRYDHYNLLRTIENVLGLGTLGRSDATAPPITGIWN
jgi:hypothetical protein